MLCREILTAFMMSPEELPGWAYLSRGTNNQSLSESNNEYLLEAHRDEAIAIQSVEVYDRYMKYLTGCAKMFRLRQVDVNQFTLEKS